MVNEISSSATEKVTTHDSDDGFLWVVTVTGDAQDHSLATLETCPNTGYVTKISIQVIKGRKSNQ